MENNEEATEDDQVEAGKQELSVQESNSASNSSNENHLENDTTLSSTIDSDSKAPDLSTPTSNSDETISPTSNGKINSFLKPSNNYYTRSVTMIIYLNNVYDQNMYIFR